jgi:hypothetical protein
MNMDITRFLVERREEQYLRHFSEISLTIQPRCRNPKSRPMPCRCASWVTYAQDAMLYSALRTAHTILAYLFFLTFVAHFGAILFHTLIVGMES